MKYYYRIKPDFYGELGKKTVVDFTKPFLQQTEYLHLHVTQMFESDISIISDCWVVTELFRQQALSMNLSGREFIDIITDGPYTVCLSEVGASLVIF